MKKNWLALLLVASVAVWTVGCGGGDKGKAKDQQQNAGNDSGGTGEPGKGDPNDPKAGDTPPVKAAETAEEAAKEWYAAQAEGRFADMWLMFPESNRTQVNEIVHAAAGKIEPATWTKAFSVLKQAATVLETKKAFILTEQNLQAVPPVVPADLVPTAYDGVVSIVQEIANSPLADHSKVTTEDAGVLLANVASGVKSRITEAASKPGAETMKSLVEDADAAVQEYTVKTVKSEGDAATLEITSKSPNFGFGDDGKPTVDWVEKTEEVEFVRVEGVWIPKEAADDMAANLPGTLKMVQDYELSQENAEMAKNVLAEVSKSLDALAAAETQEAFDMAVAAESQRLEGVLPLGGGAAEAPAGPGEFEIDPGTESTKE